MVAEERTWHSGTFAMFAAKYYLFCMGVGGGIFKILYGFLCCFLFDVIISLFFSIVCMPGCNVLYRFRFEVIGNVLL